MLRRFFTSSHARDINVFFGLKEIVYHIPLYGERRDLASPKSIKIEDHKIVVTFERDVEGKTPAKKDEEIILI